MNKESKSNNFKWIIFIAIIMLAAFTNPDKDDFKDYLTEKTIEESGEDNWLSSLISGPVIALLVDSSTIEKDYIVFTAYELNYDGNSTTYIGAFNNFIQIK